MILTNYSMQSCAVESSSCKQLGANETKLSGIVIATANITIKLSGRYEFRVCEEVLQDMEGFNVINVE